MSTQTNIRIGGAGKWAGQDSLPIPDKQKPVDVSADLAAQVASDAPLEELPEPRSFQQILDGRDTKTPVTTKATPKGLSTIATVSMVAITMLAAITALSVLMTNLGQGVTSVSSVAPSSVTSAQDSGAPSAAPPTNGVSSGMAVGTVMNKGMADEATVVAVGAFGGLLAKKADGAYGLGVVDPKNPCVPTYWSPPQVWGIPNMLAKFESEQTECYDLNGTKMQVLGYWGDTNWVFFLRPKNANADPNKAQDWDRVWSDITWYGATRAEIKALAGVKDYQQAPSASAPSPNPAPPALSQGNSGGYVEPAATPIPPCTPERYNAVVSDLKGTYYSCDGNVDALLVAHPGAVVGDAATVQQRQAELNAEANKRSTEVAAYQTQQAVDQTRREANQAATRQTANAATRATQAAQAQRDVVQATADAAAALKAAYDVLQSKITPTQGPVKCYQCHN